MIRWRACEAWHFNLLLFTRHSLHSPRIKFRSIFARQIREYNYRRMPGLIKEEDPGDDFVYLRRTLLYAVAPFNNDGFLPLQPPRVSRKNLVLGRCWSLTLHVPHYLPPFAIDDFQQRRHGTSVANK